MNEDTEQLFDSIDPELLPELGERLHMILQVLASETPLEEEMRAAWEWFDGAEGAAASDEEELGNRLYALHVRVLEPHVEPAKLASFDFIPDDNPDVGMMIHRLRVLAALTRREADGDAEFDAEMTVLVEKARRFAEELGEDEDAAFEWMDDYLTNAEDLAVADYYPEYLEELKRQSRSSE